MIEFCIHSDIKCSVLYNLCLIPILQLKPETMKQLIIILLTISSISLIAQNEQETEINKFLDQWHLYASNADMEAYFDMIDEEGIYIGTDETEIWTKEEFYEWQKPRTKDGVAWDFKAIDRNIYFGEKSKYV